MPVKRMARIAALVEDTQQAEIQAACVRGTSGCMTAPIADASRVDPMLQHCSQVLLKYSQAKAAPKVWLFAVQMAGCTSGSGAAASRKSKSWCQGYITPCTTPDCTYIKCSTGTALWQAAAKVFLACRQAKPASQEFPAVQMARDVALAQELQQAELQAAGVEYTSGPAEPQTPHMSSAQPAQLADKFSQGVTCMQSSKASQ